MRQVPQYLRYLIIGQGRTALHFQNYFKLLGIPFTTWARQHNTPEELSLASRACSNILLLISDSAIADFVKQYAFLKESAIAHFSGQLSLPGIYSAHPLMTFGESLYDLKTYQAMTFILEEDGPEMGEILPGLTNRYFKIPRRLKAYYHALCVMSGNFTCILWQKFFNEMENQFSIPKEVAFPYLARVTQNLIENPSDALTGPLVRRDINTIQANLEALRSDEFEIIYQAFVKVFQTRESKNEC